MAKNSQEKTLKENNQIIDQQEKQIDLGKSFEKQLGAISNQAEKIRKTYQDTVQQTSSIDTLLKAIKTKLNESIRGIKEVLELKKKITFEEQKASTNRTKSQKEYYQMIKNNEKEYYQMIKERLELENSEKSVKSKKENIIDNEKRFVKTKEPVQLELFPTKQKNIIDNAKKLVKPKQENNIIDNAKKLVKPEQLEIEFPTDQQEKQIELSESFEKKLDNIVEKTEKIKETYSETVKDTTSVETIIEAIKKRVEDTKDVLDDSRELQESVGEDIEKSIDNQKIAEQSLEKSINKKIQAELNYKKILKEEEEKKAAGATDAELDKLFGKKKADAAATVAAATKQEKIDKKNLDNAKDIVEQKQKEKEEIDNLVETTEARLEQEQERLDIAEKVQIKSQEDAKAAKKVGDTINSIISSLPFGGELSKIFGIDNLGDSMQKGVADNLKKVGDGAEKTKGIFSNAGAGIIASIKSVYATMLANPFVFFAGAIISLALALFKFKKEVRDLGNELGVTAEKAQDMYLGLRRAEAELKVMGFDSAKLKTTLTEMSSTFGSLDNVTVQNAKNIEKMAQEMGIAGSDVVKFSKVMMDLTGESFDTATNMAKIAANMAEAANVSTDKVMKDMQASAERFAEYSMQGAEGMAQAAIEAAKVGSELKGILDAADSLLKFETSITSQFEAQVLTGKMINTERARQLALDGDIAGLTTEIQSIVGGIGDIQQLNVIQRKSVAEAIGISVQDLMRISRGEQMQERQSVQEVITKEVGKTNELLAKIHKVDLESLEVSKDKKVTLNQNMLT